MIAGLYDLLEGLILARYSSDKVNLLQSLNAKLDILMKTQSFIKKKLGIEFMRIER